MKNYLYLVLSVLLILFVSSCVSSPSKQECSNGSDTTTLNSNYKKEQIEDIKPNKIIFSTEDINTADLIPESDIEKKLGIRDYTMDYGGPSSDFILVSEKFFIEVGYGDDNTHYSLFLNNSSEKLDFEKSLNISPYWGEPWEGGDYKKKKFEIYSDYLIHIKTEEYSEGDTTRYENFYRINDQGEFYEVTK